MTTTDSELSNSGAVTWTKFTRISLLILPTLLLFLVFFFFVFVLPLFSFFFPWLCALSVHADVLVRVCGMGLGLGLGLGLGVSKCVCVLYMSMRMCCKKCILFSLRRLFQTTLPHAIIMLMVSMWCELLVVTNNFFLSFLSLVRWLWKVSKCWMFWW